MSNPPTPAEVTAWLRENQAATQRLIAHWEGLQPSSTHSTLVEFKASLVKYASAADLIESLTAENSALKDRHSQQRGRICELEQAVKLTDDAYGKLVVERDTFKAERDGLAIQLAETQLGFRSLHSDCEEHLVGYVYSEREAANETLLGISLPAAVAQVAEWREKAELLDWLLGDDDGPKIRERSNIVSILHDDRSVKRTWLEALRAAKEAENAK